MNASDQFHIGHSALFINRKTDSNPSLNSCFLRLLGITLMLFNPFGEFILVLPHKSRMPDIFFRQTIIHPNFFMAACIRHIYLSIRIKATQ